MARRKKGRAISGWLIVDKPAGMSSAAVVNKVRWLLDARKAGHAGTLDPEATGVLAIAFGEATKTIPYVTDALKAYQFTVRWGQATNTDDGEGEVIASSNSRPTTEDIEAALSKFTGDILQVPPKFSAVKIDGQRAYALARAGQQVEIAERPLYVDALTLIAQPDEDHATFELVCGKGGYVRSVARDLGETLGCLGHVEHLRRIWTGPFHQNNAINLESLLEHAERPDITACLQPTELGLQSLPELLCSAEAAAKLRLGNAAEVISSSAAFGDEAWASLDGRAVAIGRYRAGLLHPSRVILANANSCDTT